MRASLCSLSAVTALLLLSGCVSVPVGPSVMAMPGSGKNFDQFRADDADCRQYAQSQIGGADANQSAVDAGVRSAAVGTIVGALAGAAMGGQHGAAVGAGGGLLVGSMAGTGAAQRSANGTQHQYDNAYIQCMYAKGEQVPTAGGATRRRHQAASYQQAAPDASAYPPPPPGYMPPPPGYPAR